MANKKRNSTKLSPTLMSVGVLILLVLGALGIQTPDIFQEYFGVPSTPPPATTEMLDKKTTTTSSPGDNPGPIDHGLATFSQVELVDAQQGWITYGPLDSLGRATVADALIKKDMINTGTSANSNIRPPGFISGLDPHGHSRGHLVGKQFGGSGTTMQNLVAIYQSPVNSPMMTEYENQIRRAVDQGETVRYRVTPIYNDSDLMPTEIHMEAEGLGKNATINFNVSILNLK